MSESWSSDAALLAAGLALVAAGVWMRIRSRATRNATLPDLRARARTLARSVWIFFALGACLSAFGAVQGIDHAVAQSRRDLVASVGFQCTAVGHGGRIQVTNSSGRRLRVTLARVTAGRPSQPMLLSDERGDAVDVFDASVVLGAAESRALDFDGPGKGPCATLAFLTSILMPPRWACDGLDIEATVSPAEGGWKLPTRTYCPVSAR